MPRDLGAIKDTIGNIEKGAEYKKQDDSVKAKKVVNGRKAVKAKHYPENDLFTRNVTDVPGWVLNAIYKLPGKEKFTAYALKAVIEKLEKDGVNIQS